MSSSSQNCPVLRHVVCCPVGFAAKARESSLGSFFHILKRLYRTRGTVPTDHQLHDQLPAVHRPRKKAHVGFDRAIDGIRVELRRRAPAPGFEHTICSCWSTCASLRRTSSALRRRKVRARHEIARRLWPNDPGPPNAEAWDRSVAYLRARSRAIQGARARYSRSVHPRSDRRGPQTSSGRFCS